MGWQGRGARRRPMRLVQRQAPARGSAAAGRQGPGWMLAQSQRGWCLVPGLGWWQPWLGLD